MVKPTLPQLDSLPSAMKIQLEENRLAIMCDSVEEGTCNEPRQ
jgi:hypothetical protein